MNTKNLANRYNLRADVEYGAPDNPDFPASNPWTVTLKPGRRRMTVPYYTGFGITGEPEAADVLDCLLSDASGADQDFEDWAGDYGFDVDSRKAERVYNAIQRQSKKLHRFLADHYDEFYEAERL